MLIHRSPALTAIYNEIKNSDRNRVLDLGPMSQGCFKLFSTLSCKITVENLAEFIRNHYLSGGDAATLDIDHYLLEYGEEEQFDVILAWDLLNYLDSSEISKLFEKLRPHCKPNTLLYMLRYVEKKIPVAPREFYVKDQYLIELSEDELKDRQVPNSSTLQLLSAMPGYFMQDTLLGQMGMLPGITEHVMRYSASGQSKHLISKSETSRTAAVEAVESQSNLRRHLSPAIADVVSLLQCSDSMEVLDLGAAVNRPEDLIVKRSGAYYRADVYSLIERSRAKQVDRLNLSILDKEMSRKFDVILAWDLFNYCTPSQIQQLDQALSRLCHENTFLLAFMYTGRAKPARPSKFEVKDGNEIQISSIQETSENTITGVSLLRMLQAYNMDKTYAYREGMDREVLEYIFSYRAAVVPAVVAQSESA